jgi:hypothetical protein
LHVLESYLVLIDNDVMAPLHQMPQADCKRMSV